MAADRPDPVAWRIFLVVMEKAPMVDQAVCAIEITGAVECWNCAGDTEIANGSFACSRAITGPFDSASAMGLWMG